MDNMEEPGVSGTEMDSEHAAENQEFVEGQDYSSEEDEDEESDDDSASDDDDEAEDNEEEEEGEEVDENEDDDDDDGDDDEDDEEGDEESEEEEVLSQSGEAVEAEGASSGDETSDRCPICLNRLRQQDVGMPETCDHLFCLECIQEWSKNVNTCPVDRQVFHIILAKHAGEDKVFKQ
ncbi:PHD and RING finger domain-containing protein 1, partial [Plakobranchus ocellatus]